MLCLAIVMMAMVVIAQEKKRGLWACKSIDEKKVFVSWRMRSTDDQHQFGGPGNAQIVCGDMNVYGRVYMSTVGRGVICGTCISDEDTNINTLSAPQTSSLFREGIYDLQGRRYSERPSAQGLYIQNGKKILIK